MPALIEKVKAGPGTPSSSGIRTRSERSIAGLGVSEPVKLADNDYDNLFVVVAGERSRP